MSHNFETTIGIEIHIELNTKSKMFSAAPNAFNALPNTNISIIDLGYPGAMPSVNQAAVTKAIKLAKALKMDIDHELHFDRKHYFYPDLPRGFQITQHFRPIGQNGILQLANNQQVKIARIHLEEDSAKALHQKGKTLLDYNRAGIPLIEIVTAPVMHSAEEAKHFIEAIRQLVQWLDISDAKMEEGSLRADLNISVRPYGQSKLGTKVEIKNINSITNAYKAIVQEIALQENQIIKGIAIEQTTKRFDDQNHTNVVMRKKKEVADYKYFPEPNLPPIVLSQAFINAIKVGDLPWIIAQKFHKLGFKADIIRQLLNDRSKLDFLNQINYKDQTKAIKVFFAEVVALANKEHKQVHELAIDPTEIKYLLEQAARGAISGAHIKKIIPLLMGHQKASHVIQVHGFKQISDELTIMPMIDAIIASHQDFIAQNINRKERVYKFILGQIMKISKGQVNPIVAIKLVKIKLGV